MKKKRTYNPYLIKAKRAYTLKEIVEVYKLHPWTIQAWRKAGLKAIDETTKPLLIAGEELRSFLKQRRRRYPIKSGEFFCTKCRASRKSHPEQLSYEITDKKLGKTSKQGFIRGSCIICNNPLMLFSSDRKIQELQKEGLLLPEHERTLSGSAVSSINTGILRGC